MFLTHNLKYFSLNLPLHTRRPHSVSLPNLFLLKHFQNKVKSPHRFASLMSLDTIYFELDFRIYFPYALQCLYNNNTYTFSNKKSF